MNNQLLFSTTLLFSLLLLFIGQHVNVVDAVGGSAEEKTRRDTCACLVKEPKDNEQSDEKEDCSPFAPKPATSSPAPTSSSGAPSSSSSTDAPSSSSSSSSDSPSTGSSSSSTDSPSSSSSASPSSSSSAPANCSTCQFHSRCRLKHALVNMSYELSVTEKVDFDIFIRELEIEVLSGGACGCLSAEDKVVKAGKKIKKHFKKHPSHKAKLHYKSIGKWGKMRDFEKVSVDIQDEKADGVSALDANGENKMFEALRNCTGNSSDTLIVNLRVELKKTYLKKNQKRAKLHRRFKSFIKLNPSMEQTINDCEIQGSGDIESFRDVFKAAHQATRLKKVISGSNDSDCELLFRMQEQCNNVSHNVTQRLQLKQLHDVIQAKFQVEVSLVIRLQYVSQQIFECLQLSPWVMELIMDIKMHDDLEPLHPGSGTPDTDCSCDDGEWGDVYELAFVSHLCTNDNDCADSADGEGTEPTGQPTSSTAAASSSSSSAAPSSSSSAAPSSSSSAAPSSSSSAAPSSSSSSAAPTSSSAAPTSTAPPTTTPTPTCDCTKRWPVADPVSPGNGMSNDSSWLEYSMEVWATQYMSGGEFTGYSSLRNNIRACARGTLNNANFNCVGKQHWEKVNSIRGLLMNYNKNQVGLVYRNRLMQIVIRGYSYHGFFGKVADFAGDSTNAGTCGADCTASTCP